MDNFLTHNAYTLSPTSEKITLAHMDCKARVYGFTETASGSNVWYVDPPQFVIACQNGATSLTEVSSSGAVSASGEFHYDVVNSRLYVYTTDGFTNESTDPEVIPTYRLFFSSAPISLSYDLSNDIGEEVYYEPRIEGTPGFNTKIDNDQTGISVTGQGTIKLNNGDLFFDTLYDLYNFENKEVSIYSYNRSLVPSDAKLLYRGSITEKSFTQKSVSFKVKDAITALNESIPLTKFSEITGTISITPEVEKYVTRRVYGFVEGLQCQSVDMLYDSTLDSNSYTLSGTVSTSATVIRSALDSKLIIGTNFLTEVTIGDDLTVNGNTYTIDKVISDTKLLILDDVDVTFTNEVGYITPQKSYYNKNRKVFVCDHSFPTLSTTITEVKEKDRFVVVSANQMNVGDVLLINTEYIPIKRISGNEIVLNQNLSALPSVSDVVSKELISSVQIRYPAREQYADIVLDRDEYTISNNANGTFITLTEDAEREATSEKMLSGNFFILNGYDTVWLGKPTIFKIECPANVAQSLYGKYFSVYSDDKEYLFYYTKKVDQDETATFTYSLDLDNVNSSTNVFTAFSHSLSEGDIVFFSSTGTSPGGINEEAGYYVIPPNDGSSFSDYFSVSVTNGGTVKNVTSGGTGTRTVTTEKEIEAPQPSFLTSTGDYDTVNNKIYEPNHLLQEGQRVSFTNPDTIPVGITSGYKYYVREWVTESANYFQISATVDGPINTFSTQGSGQTKVTVETETSEIVLTSDNLTASEVAEQTLDKILEEIDTYYGVLDSQYLKLYTKKGVNIPKGDEATSGVIIERLVAGQESKQSIDLTNHVEERDFILPKSTNFYSFREVLEVNSESIRLRGNIEDLDGFYRILIKNVGYLDNDSFIYVDLYGKDNGSSEIITDGANIVKDLLTEVNLASRLDSGSFTDASESLPYLMSVKIPDKISDESPTLKTVIDKVNKTVLGSLVLVDELQLAYNTLDSERTTQTLPTIYDDDIISWSIKNRGKAYKDTITRYNHTDIDKLEYSEYLYESELVKYNDSNLTIENDLYLHGTADAEECSQRILYYNSLTRSDITINGKLNLFSYEMGDKVILDLDNIYYRLGNSASKVIIGSVTSVSRNGESVELIISTQGNIFSRVAVIADNDAPDYSSATESDRLYGSYIVEDDGTISEDNDLQGCNAIG